MNDAIQYYRVELPYACFGIDVKKGVVVGAAPMGKWMIGNPIRDIRVWVVEHKKGKLELIK